MQYYFLLFRPVNKDNCWCKISRYNLLIRNVKLFAENIVITSICGYVFCGKLSCNYACHD